MVTTMMPESHVVLAAGNVESNPLVSFAWIMAAAVMAPLISWATGKRVPAVVLLIGAGILIGPHWLGLASTEGGVGLLKQLGLGMLFLLAGYEINPAMIRSREGRTSATTWLVCMGLSFAGACALLHPHNTSTAVVLAIAFTSTAVGTLMPIMKQQQVLHTPVGRSLLVHGAIGEIFPIFAMALLLSARSTWVTAIVLAAFFVIALVVAAIPRTVRFLLPWTARHGSQCRGDEPNGDAVGAVDAGCAHGCRSGVRIGCGVGCVCGWVYFASSRPGEIRRGRRAAARHCWVFVADSGVLCVFGNDRSTPRLWSDKPWCCAF